ncbi:MAG: MMPL family transporter [Acidimicrobiales bacterium]
MFTRLATAVVRFRKLVLALTVGFVLAAGIIGAPGVFGVLQSGGFEDPEAESTRAGELLGERFEAREPNVVLLVTAERGTVDDPANAADGTELTEQLAEEPGVTQVVSYWTLGQPPPLRSEDASHALILGRVGDGDLDGADVLERLEEDFAGDRDGFTVEIGGPEAVSEAIGEQVETDLGVAERIAVPVTLVLLVIVFGSVVAAALPLAVGIIAVLGTFLVLFVIGSITDVSIFSINLATAMGLGLAIDYSLFIVSRFREELRRGHDPHRAVIHTVETAGRTVAFSALTVAVSLSALLVFPLYFLRSFAYSGIAVVVLAMLASLLSLPALLAVIGHRVDSLQLWRRQPKPVGEGFWHRVATFVMRRPIPIAVAVVAFLVLLGLPFLNVEFGLPDDRVLPADAEARHVSEVLRAEFASNESEAFEVVATDIGDPETATPEIEAYAVDLSAVDGVARVDSLAGSYVDGRQVLEPDESATRFAGDDATWFSVVPGVEPVSPEGEALVKRLRGVDSPLGETLAGGTAGQLVDSKDSIFSRAPLAGGIIALSTFVLLFLSFGSLLVPLKAIVLNLLSLTATFGAMVWIFQDGNGSGLLDFTATGTLDTTTPILMFCIAFGLSMDYEVFLLSRVKEEHDRTGDNTQAVAMGLERTGRIVTAAAAVLSVTFIAFSTSGITFIKLMGIGLALAVVMDATIIRATLVPAFMRLAGEANWWAPRPLRRIHERFGIREAPDLEPEPEPAPNIG